MDCDCRLNVSTKLPPIKYCALHSAAPDLLAACEAIVELLDSGVLIRNTANDDEPDWAVRQIPIIQKLALLPKAIAKAQG